MRRRTLLFAGALCLLLGCKDSTSPNPQPEPKPKPEPPATGMVVRPTAPDTAISLQR